MALPSPVISVVVPPPSLSDNTGDADRLAAALRRTLDTFTLEIDFSLLPPLSSLLRSGTPRMRCVVVGDPPVVCGLFAETEFPVVGAAVDLGTTRIVLRLVNLETGETLGERPFDNPQATVGPDILTRLHHADTEGGLDHLHRLVIEGVNHQLDILCRSANIGPGHLSFLTVAGNTAMTHLFLGLPPKHLFREPYIPVTNRPGLVNARDIGITASPAAKLYVFPNVGSYFGGDLIAGILHTKMHESEELSLLVDIGTNAEVVLGDRDWLTACAGAAGPALEGGVTRMGAAAAPGVIDHVSVTPGGDFTYTTIGGEAPRGICGSGVIDLAAALFAAGKIDIRGKLVPEACKDRLTTLSGVSAFILVPAAESATGEALAVSQADLDSLIRSKAAMYTILETITSTVGVTFDEISTFHVAGTFGVFIDPESAVTIGMIPDFPRSVFRPVGNSSLAGATRLLKTPSLIKEANRIRDRITYLELNVNQDFMNRFSAAKFLPHTDRKRFPSVG
jgi:uncharacterized 2Fe-2S/4Fe-4S cluster protein (DUF4445 family)